MQIETLSVAGLKLTNPGGNYTTNGYPTRIPTKTSPDQVAAGSGIQAKGDGVIEMGGKLGGLCPNNLMLIPFGVDASTHTMSMKILGWSQTISGNGPNAVTSLWIPIELATLAITLGSATGVAGSDVLSTQSFGTTITCTGGPTFVTSGAAPVSLDWLQISPGSNSIGMVCVRSFGFAFLEAIFTTGGVVTSCNALYRKF